MKNKKKIKRKTGKILNDLGRIEIKPDSDGTLRIFTSKSEFLPNIRAENLPEEFGKPLGKLRGILRVLNMSANLFDWAMSLQCVASEEIEEKQKAIMQYNVKNCLIASSIIYFYSCFPKKNNDKLANAFVGSLDDELRTIENDFRKTRNSQIAHYGKSRFEEISYATICELTNVHIGFCSSSSRVDDMFIRCENLDLGGYSKLLKCAIRYIENEVDYIEKQVRERPSLHAD